MKIIKYEEIKNTGLDERTMYKWAIDVLKLKKDTILPSKISMKENGHIFYNIMPSVIFNC